MDELLNAVTSVKTTPKDSQKPKVVEIAPETVIKDLDGALEILKESPTSSQLGEVLKFLVDEANASCDTKAAQITNFLITHTILDWWELLRDDRELWGLKSSLIDYLCEATALSSLASKLRSLTTSCRNLSQVDDTTSGATQLKILLELLEEIITSDDVVQKVYYKCMSAASRPRQETLWKEFVSLTSSGRLLSTVSEAEEVLHNKVDFRGTSWVSHGDEFCKWLARNIAVAAASTKKPGKVEFSALATLFGKALMLGYPDALIGSLLEELPLRNSSYLKHFKQLCGSLPAYQERIVLLSTLQYLNRQYLSNNGQTETSIQDQKPADIVNDCAAFVKELTDGNDMLIEYLVELCVNIESSILARWFGLQRVVLASLSDDEEQLTPIVEKAIAKFGDQLFIRHAPIVQQEAITQLLLMACGYVYRRQPMLLFTITKSSIQTHGISNRLKAPSQRAQWLGMIVGMSLSELTDRPGSKLVFDDEAMHTPEGKWYQALVHVDDKIGNLNRLQTQEKRNIKKTAFTAIQKSQTRSLRPKQENTFAPLSNEQSIQQSLRIVELDDDEEGEEEEDIVPYAKPDSDPEDEEGDPTLIERNKPKPPVYIRDLLEGLRGTENYNRHRLALETASALIRRKANFGKEVSDHAEELASVLMNLNNQFEMDEFLELRQEALISLLISQPRKIAPLLACSCFEGSYSIQQRAAILIALALGARELGGYKDEERPEAPNFPSKELPQHLQEIYSEESRLRFARASDRLEQTMVEPLALNAADQLTGPNALKVRTFSSRIDVQKKKAKGIANSLSKDVGDWFFFPLIGGWWTQVQSFGQRTITFSEHLLPLYLRTLAVILHASGPSTLSLPQMTTEFWDLLLSIRTNALNDNEVNVLESLLFAFLTLLELNEDKQRLANEHARELVETQEWAKLVLDRYGSVASSGESESRKVKTLAAAVVVKCHEVVERWQRLMLGDMVDM